MYIIILQIMFSTAFQISRRFHAKRIKVNSFVFCGAISVGICINYTLCGVGKTMAAAIKIPNLAHNTVMVLFIVSFFPKQGERNGNGWHSHYKSEEMNLISMCAALSEETACFIL